MHILEIFDQLQTTWIEGRKQPPTFENCWEIFREIFEKPSLNLQRLSSKFSELNGGSLVVFRISLKFRSNFCLQKRRFETASHCVCYVAGVENARKGFTQNRHFVSRTGSFSCKSNLLVSYESFWMRIGFETEVQGNLELGYSWQSLINKKVKKKKRILKINAFFKADICRGSTPIFYLFIHFARCSVAFSLNDIL